MKKKFLFVLLAILTLTACTPQVESEVNSLETTADSSDLSRESVEDDESQVPLSEKIDAAYRIKKTKVYTDDSEKEKPNKEYDITYYDEHDNLICTEVYDYFSNEFARTREIHYEYDEDGNILTDKEYSSLWHKYEYRDGKNIKTYIYSGDEIIGELTYEFNENGDVISSIDENGHGTSWEYEYDEKGREIIRRDYGYTNELDCTIYSKYDDNNLIEKKRVNEKYFEFQSDDSMITRYVYTYDEKGNIISTTKTYETLDEIVSTTFLEMFEYDEQNRVIREECFNGENSLYVIDYVYETSWS